MRGKVTLQDVPCDSVGITPRVCGEKVWQTACEVVVKGSPPAYAGKRVRCSQQALPCTDHPRMCGEKRQDRLDYYVPQGSPPHVRGKAKGDELGLSQTRITPACAGKRDKTGWTTTCPRDHPRMCGEKPKVMNLVLVRPGSPPHVRGKELRTAFKPCRLGITPACAGKSQCACTRARSARDHPRMCGEKQSNSRIRMIQKGSPPHVRGKVLSVNFFGGHFGITPACAGKSCSISA